MEQNPFILPITEYKRDLDIMHHYVRDTALYLSKMTGKEVSECAEYVKSTLRAGGTHEFKDRAVTYLERGENEDRVRKTCGMYQYIKHSLKKEQLIAPTFTTYTHPKHEQSLLVNFIDDNIAGRKKARKEQKAASVSGDKTLEIFKKQEQTGRKLSNNAMSGGHASASTPLYNPTAHSTLTSNCRCTSGYGNANNEKFLAGNRHYWHPVIAKNNIISIINNTDYAQLQATMDKYQLCYPSIAQTMTCITRSTSMYWKTKREVKNIEALVETLTPIERAAFVYTGDFYHLMKLNQGMIRYFLSLLCKKVPNKHPDPAGYLKNVPESYLILAAMICEQEMKGLDFEVIRGTPTHDLIASTSQNIVETIESYADFIRTFFVTKNVPASLATFPDSIRRVVVTSDTDSTIFTVQDWVIWYNGQLDFGPNANALAAVMIFLASETITHILAKMSANFGIEEKRLFQIAMKNEYKFDVFVPTQVAKHYFAIISAQEGNIKKSHELQIKGVHLKSSNVPKTVVKAARDMMEELMLTVVKGEKISVTKVLKEITDVEKNIIRTIERGENDFFKSGQIKTPDSYKEGVEAANYQQFEMWQSVFAPKYGSIAPPPYTGIKISVGLNTPSKTKEWLDSLEDQDFVERMKLYLTSRNKRHIGATFIIPEQILLSTGIPREVMQTVDIRKIVADTTYSFYLILETLGIYMRNDKLTRLCYDTY